MKTDVEIQAELDRVALKKAEDASSYLSDRKDLEAIATKIQEALKYNSEKSVANDLSLGLKHLEAIRTAANQTANDLNQIRNLLAALIFLGMVWFLATLIIALTR